MLKTKNEIENWLDEYNIQNTTIHDNLIVDIDGDVDISGKELTEIPVQFGIVTGHFFCDNNQLTSLHYAPQTVGKDFDCYNNELISLEGAPQTVGGSFWCFNNPITDFNNFDFEVEGSMYFTPTNELIYFNEFEDGEGDIRIDFRLLKIMVKAHNLDNHLSDELNQTNIVKPQKFKI